MNNYFLYFVLSSFVVFQSFCEPPGGYTDRCSSIYVENGYYMPNNFFVPVNQEITYKCFDDFILIGSETLVCQPGGWDKLPPVCEPKFSSKKCPRQVEVFENGIIEGPDKDEYNPGERLWYICNDDSVLVGDHPDVTCLSDGTWNYPAPICELQVFPCQFRDAPENGNQDPVQDIYHAGDVVTYTCNEPYELVGKLISLCLPTGMWSYEVPICEAPTCRDPITPSNGYFGPKLEEYVAGEMVTFNCFRHYKLEGVRKITCLENGQWSDVEPECRAAKCLPLEAPENGSLNPEKDSYKIGERIVFKCEDNFSLNGLRAVTCGENEQWSGPVPSCDGQQCPRPIIDNGSFEEDKPIYEVNDFVNFSCNPGYVREGAKRIDCMENGRWSSSFPTCRRIKCKRPNFDNGHLKEDKDYYYVGALVQFICKPGYELFGQEYLTCIDENTFSDHIPTCNAVKCPRPFLLNGKLDADKDLYYIGEYVDFSCNNGFSLTGNKALRCLRNGDWSGNFPKCNANKCTKPFLENGFFTNEQDVYSIGDSVNFFCNNGFVRKGAKTITCRDNSRWNAPFPECIPVLCKRPNILNGDVDMAKEYFDVGDMVIVSCDRGFDLRGIQKLTCQDNGDWSSDFPVCIAINCKRPTFDNGVLIVDKSFYGVHDTVLFKCNPGYKLEGKLVLKCNFDGTWSDEFPKCKALQCARPMFDNGFLTIDKDLYDVGEQVKFTCNDGFFLKGSEYLTCQDNGQFPHKIPVCIAVTCDRPFIENGSFDDDSLKKFRVGEIVKFSCDDEYYLDGADTIICGSNGKWSNPFPTCRQFACPQPNINSGGFKPFRMEYRLNDVISFFCNPGYSLDGQKKLKCLSRGLWSGDFPTCVPNRCVQPEIPFGSFVEVQPFYNVGETVTFSCDGGFQLIGAKTIVCEEDGQWSENVPTCQGVQCERPDVSNGVFFSPSQRFYEVGQTVTFRCRRGNMLVGFNQAECLSSGEWSVDFPTCEANSCEQPFLEDGSFSPFSTSYNVGAKVTFECDEGFVLTGTVSIRCRSDGSWSDDFPKCIRVTCREPFILRGSFFPEQNEYFPENEVTFSCNDAGFELVGEETITCLVTGEWSDPFPMCMQIQCEPPQRNPYITSIMPSKNLYYVGDIVTFKCRPGFELVGSVTSTCQDDRSWSPVEPTCRRVITCRPPTKPKYSTATPYKRIYQVGETITYNCNHGRVIEGNSVITCENNGRFSPRVPKCVLPAKTCRRPYIPRFGSISPDQAVYTVGSKITFACSGTYAISGAEYAICLSNGQWSESVPSCKFKTSHSCQNRCNQRWNTKQPCQCNRFCKYVKGSCCEDYYDTC